MDITSEYERGFQLRCEGNYGEAKAVFQGILMQNPDHVKARLQFGLIQGFEGDFDGSLETLNDLSAKNPANLDVRYGLAMTQMMLGMYDEGCGNLKYILSVDPNHEEALRQSAYC
ncbi:MAG: tetratricopeptide repeat protein [Fimbriimonadales bacterium]